MKNFYVHSLLCLTLAFYHPWNLQAQCNIVEERVTITFQGDENYLLDNSRWEITTEEGAVLASGQQDSVFCLPSDRCYTFTVYDDFGDGLSGQQPGFFSLAYADEEVATAINYGFSVSALFGDCTVGSSCFAPLDIMTGETYRIENAEAWYLFQPMESGYYEWSTCGLGNDCNTTIWIYERCLGLTGRDDVEETLLFNEDGCSDEPEQAYLSSVLQAGLTYYFRIGGAANSCINTGLRWQFNYLGPVIGCTDPSSCNYDPLATEDDGSCLYEGNPNCPAGPDLIIAPGVLLNSLRTDIVSESNCYINEGCLQGYGPREVVRFTTHIKNIGTEDYVIGERDGRNEQFEFDECHGHWHYEGYAEYRLYDAEGRILPAGFKNGFCVIDLECSGGGTPTYGCSYMGISAGCGDIYSSGLDCQWVDMTDLPDGEYTLAMLVNWDRDPDIFGRHETNYDNNIDVVCFNVDRSSGNMQVTARGGWGCFADCGGSLTGENQYDCLGVCGGDARHGDLNGNGVYEIGDVDQYLNGILDATIPVTSCTELTSNEIVDIEDVAWLMDCILVENRADEHQSHAHSCELPTIGIFNPYQQVGFAMIEHNSEAGYVDIGLRCPDVSLIATHLVLSGLEIAEVESLLPAESYNAMIRFRPDGQVITLSYDFSTIPRRFGYQPFLRIHYSAQTAENICLSEVRQVVNRRLETLTAEFGIYACVSDTENCLANPENDSDGDGVCDLVDICPNGDDNFDMDQDGIPDACDDCPLSATGDTDGDGVCDNVDVCPDGNDNFDMDNDGTPDACDDCPLSPTGDSDNDTICDNLDRCPGADDRLDADADGVPDACDICPGQVDEDIDGDGVCDYIDTCLGGDDNLDADGDGIPDACDICPLSSLNSDIDTDGVCDDIDICIGADDRDFLSELRLDIQFDDYPGETYWHLENSSGEVLWSGDEYDEQGVLRSFSYLGNSGDYVFRFFDRFGDGLCCRFGEGYFSLVDMSTGEEIIGGSSFEDSVEHRFSLSTSHIPDEDQDGVCDPADICPGFNDLADADDDGVPDACDACPNSATGDSDNDTVCDDLDQCPGHDDLIDIDMDGIPDACDDMVTSVEGVQATPPLLKVFPNPTDGMVYLHLNNRISGQVIVYDLWGKSVMNMLVNKQRELTLDVQSIPSGTYILVVTNTNGEMLNLTRLVKF